MRPDGTAKRKHVATGRPRGGKRPGAGRPGDVTEALPRCAAKAIKAAKLADLHDPDGHEAFGVVLAVMRGQIRKYGTQRLSAAGRVLDERRGKPVQRVEVTGQLSLEQLVADSYKPDAPNRSSKT